MIIPKLTKNSKKSILQTPYFKLANRTWAKSNKYTINFFAEYLIWYSTSRRDKIRRFFLWLQCGRYHVQIPLRTGQNSFSVYCNILGDIKKFQLPWVKNRNSLPGISAFDLVLKFQQWRVKYAQNVVHVINKIKVICRLMLPLWSRSNL